MEAILGLVGIYIAIVLVRVGLDALGRAGGKAVRKIQGKPEPYFGKLQIRATKSYNEDLELDVYDVDIRGEIPSASAGKIGINLSLLDIEIDSDGEEIRSPIISFIDSVQEDNSLCFSQGTHGIDWAPGTSFVNWVPIGRVVPQLIQTPKRGKRTIRFSATASPDSDPKILEHGFLTDAGTLLAVAHTDIEIEISHTGYQEALQERDDAREIAVSIAVFTAMSDGELADDEGLSIQSWMRKTLEQYTDSRVEEMKRRLNDAFLDAMEKANAGTLALTDLCERFVEKADDQAKFSLIELCMEVMAADGIMAPEEMETIHQIGNAIEFDVDELIRMRDEKFVSSNLTANSDDGWSILGIDHTLSDQEKKKRLTQEFQKWNDRLNSLSAGDERDNAQAMLNVIAKLRKDIS